MGFSFKSEEIVFFPWGRCVAPKDCFWGCCKLPKICQKKEQIFALAWFFKEIL